MPSRKLRQLFDKRGVDCSVSNAVYHQPPGRVGVVKRDHDRVLGSILTHCSAPLPVDQGLLTTGLLVAVATAVISPMSKKQTWRFPGSSLGVSLLINTNLFSPCASVAL